MKSPTTQCFIYNIGIRGTHISILRLALFHVELSYFKLSVPFLLNGVSFRVSLSLYIYEKIKISTWNQFFRIRLTKFPYWNQVPCEKCDLKYIYYTREPPMVLAKIAFLHLCPGNISLLKSFRKFKFLFGNIRHEIGFKKNRISEVCIWARAKQGR